MFKKSLLLAFFGVAHTFAAAHQHPIALDNSGVVENARGVLPLAPDEMPVDISQAVWGRPGNFFMVRLLSKDARKIAGVINEFAGRIKIKPENILITWDFDDTLAMTLSRPLGHFMSSGRFSSDSAFLKFKKLFLDVLVATGIIDGQMTLKDIDPKLLGQGPYALTREELQKFIHDFVNCPNAGHFENSLWQGENQNAAPMRTRISSFIAVVEDRFMGNKSPSMHVLKDQALRDAMVNLHHQNIQMKILSNGVETPEKKHFFAANFPGNPFEWVAMNGEDKLTPLLKISGKVFPKTIQKLPTREKYLIVHVDDKVNVLSKAGLAIRNGQVSPIPSNATVLQIFWHKFESSADEFFIDDKMLQDTTAGLEEELRRHRHLNPKQAGREHGVDALSEIRGQHGNQGESSNYKWSPRRVESPSPRLSPRMGSSSPRGESSHS